MVPEGFLENDVDSRDALRRRGVREKWLARRSAAAACKAGCTAREFRAGMRGSPCSPPSPCTISCSRPS